MFVLLIDTLYNLYKYYIIHSSTHCNLLYISVYKFECYWSSLYTNFYLFIFNFFKNVYIQICNFLLIYKESNYSINNFNTKNSYFLFFLNKSLLQNSFIIIFFLTILSLIIFSFSKISTNQSIVISSTKFTKGLIILSFFLSLSIFLIYMYIYINLINTLNLQIYNNFYIIIPQIYFFNITLTVDFFGLVILLLAYLVGFLSFLALDNKLFYKNIKYFFFLNIFIIIVFFYITTNNILILFLFYEFLLIPSFLLVFYISPSRKSTQAALYFVIWTQIGSFLVLCAIFYIISTTGCLDFFLIKNYNFSPSQVFIISFLLFLGFGFKVPIWPFHYWLTKTHVEAPSGFSMYLSGFLVKTALYGFYKIVNLLGLELNSILFSTICLLGVIDASLKMWGQTDLKKLVAYGTIQEMNIIYLVFCWGDTNNVISGVLFCITHAFLSTLMFFLVDCIYRRYFSRSVIEISGILNKTPNLGISILLMCVFYSGLPGTLKFTSEFYIFSSFFEISPLCSLLTIFIANCFGLIGFSKCWFNVVYGMSNKNNSQLILDLSLKELMIIQITYFILVITCFIPNLKF